MGYNKYRWFSTKPKPKTLPNSHTLLLRIRNGDYSISHYFAEVNTVEEEYESGYKDTWSKYPNSDNFERHHLSHESVRMKNVRKLKLEEVGMLDEIEILNKLRKELKKEFGKDLWETATSVETNLKTIEDIYWFYYKNTK